MFRLINRQLVLSKPTIESLQLEGRTFHQKLLSLYKQYYRLRNMVGATDVDADRYTTLVRRRFRQDFNIRRQALGYETVGETEVIRRLTNTLMFVFNATVKATDKYDTTDVLYYRDIKRTDTATTERKIVDTILQMDREIPKDIKYDYKYRWLEEQTERDAMINTTTTKDGPKQGKSAKINSQHLKNIGFVQYERTVMRLNESMALML